MLRSYECQLCFNPTLPRGAPPTKPHRGHSFSHPVPLEPPNQSVCRPRQSCPSQFHVLRLVYPIRASVKNQRLVSSFDSLPRALKAAEFEKEAFQKSVIVKASFQSSQKGRFMLSRTTWSSERVALSSSVNPKNHLSIFPSKAFGRSWTIQCQARS